MILNGDALSALIAGDGNVREILTKQRHAAIPAIVLDAWRAQIVGSPHRKAYEQWLDNHLKQFALLAITADTVVLYGKLSATVTQGGLTLPADDVWVAALAIQHALPILSLDQRFDEMPGVRRIGF